MFTGIIEETGEVLEIRTEKGNRHFRIRSRMSAELKPDQSVAHQGVCLTVTHVEQGSHWVTAVDETLGRSNLGDLKPGDFVNLERSMPVGGRLDGHIVQGHVDQTGTCLAVTEDHGSWLFDFSFQPSPSAMLVEKGSICVNGVSLTCFGITDLSFRVAIIPYTFHHTTFQFLKPGDRVNLEFDIIGKYVQRLMQPYR
ncbi:MAG: riboflavin synthase [Cyclobacteriaceae bacterium]|nr:riboflavin synthase [Cyclobacteriaceae bacterium]MCX7637637.1 riboflavin synthase [Cyclobacteriaceae bacterium]MDW8331697.1 riboflavin synthase [Cyclobacteriaceae bacterium]